MPKVSIIIPIYNTEKYLKKCLDSIVNQTLKDIEIICVNDGSTDNSLKILEEYASRDDRIKIINQKNQVVSVARNTGISIADGEYIGFCDSDDYVEPDFLSSWINDAKDDIIIFSFRRINNNSIEFDDLDLVKIYNRNKNLDTILHLMHISCNKLYKNSFIKENNIYFPTGLKTAEDGIFCINCLKHNPSISVKEKVFYNYVVSNSNSAINRYNMVETEIESFKYLLNSGIYEDLNDDLRIFTLNKFIFCFMAWYNKPEKQKYRRKNKKLLLKLKKYLKKNIEPSILEKSYFYNEQLLPIRSDYSELLRHVFSLYNSSDGRHKILTILGLKLKIKRKTDTKNNKREK